MTLRAPNPMNNSQALLDLLRTKGRYADYIQQLTTGKRIVNVGDDPTGTALIMDFSNSIKRNGQYVTLIDNAASMLKGSENALDSVNNTLTRLLELAQQGGSDTTTASGRATLAKEVDSLRTDLISTANTQEQGKYLFAGTLTTTVPFADDTSTVPQSVTYSGNGGLVNLDVSISSTVTTNLPGNEVFFGPGGQGSATDLFAAVTALRDALTANDTAQIKTAATNLKSISDRVNGLLTDLGGRQSSLSALKDNLESFSANLKSIQDSYEAVDYPTAIMGLNKESVAQEAILRTMGKVNQSSLFDYLG
jgi:flagellar hook-associated protein 3 FlgL